MQREKQKERKWKKEELKKKKKPVVGRGEIYIWFAGFRNE